MTFKWKLDLDKGYLVCGFYGLLLQKRQGIYYISMILFG